MDTPVTDDEMRVIALEEGLKSCLRLDKLRLAMLNDAVSWIADVTGLDVMEVRREIAHQKGGQVFSNLATIKAVRSFLVGADVPNQ